MYSTETSAAVFARRPATSATSSAVSRLAGALTLIPQRNGIPSRATATQRPSDWFSQSSTPYDWRRTRSSSYRKSWMDVIVLPVRRSVPAASRIDRTRSAVSLAAMAFPSAVACGGPRSPGLAARRIICMLSMTRACTTLIPSSTPRLVVSPVWSRSRSSLSSRIRQECRFPGCCSDGRQTRGCTCHARRARRIDGPRGQTGSGRQSSWGDRSCPRLWRRMRLRAPAGGRRGRRGRVDCSNRIAAPVGVRGRRFLSLGHVGLILHDAAAAVVRRFEVTNAHSTGSAPSSSTPAPRLEPLGLQSGPNRSGGVADAESVVPFVDTWTETRLSSTTVLGRQSASAVIKWCGARSWECDSVHGRYLKVERIQTDAGVGIDLCVVGDGAPV